MTIDRNIVLLKHNGLVLVFFTTKMLALFAKQYFIRYLDFKSSILHCSFMENIKIGVIFCLYKNLFFIARLNRFLYFWEFKCQISARRFLNH